MKPTRGLSPSRTGTLPRERRMALFSVAALLALLGAIVLYQQYQRKPSDPSQLPPNPVDIRPADPSSSSGAEPMDAQAGAETAADTEGAAESSAAAPATAATPPTRLGLPLAGSPRTLKAYGSLDAAYHDFRYYTAIAYEVAVGEPVVAAASGTVVSIEENPAEGTELVLDHGGGMTTRYAGLGRVLAAVGDEVEAGAAIGETGGPTPTRSALGPHLAFGVSLDGRPTDPAPFLKP